MWWSPPAPGTFPSSEAERFGDLLETAIARRAADAAVYLSGGVDSAGVAAAAAAALPKPPLALSVVFEGASEERTQRLVAADLGLDQLFATAVGDDLLERGLRRIEGSIWPTPALWAPVFDGLAEHAVARGATLLFDGIGGDELLDPGIAAGRALRRRPIAFARWLRAESRFTTTARSSLRAVLAPRAGPPLLPDWVAPDPALRRALEERLVSPPRDLASTHEADLLDPVAAAGREEAFTHSASLGLTRHHPLWDPGVVELLFGLDPAGFSAGGLPKAPVRGYLARRVPSLTGPWPRPEYADHVLAGMFSEAGRLAGGGFPFLEELGISPRARDTPMFDPEQMLAILRVERWIRSGEMGARNS